MAERPVIEDVPVSDGIVVGISMRHRNVFGKKYVRLDDLIEEVRHFDELQKDGYEINFSNLLDYLKRMAND